MVTIVGLNGLIALLYFTFSHLADAFIQSDLQIRKVTKTESENSVNTNTHIEENKEI